MPICVRVKAISRILVRRRKAGKITGGRFEGHVRPSWICVWLGGKVDTICLVFLESMDSERVCLVSILISAFLGFLAGFVTWTETKGKRLSTAMAARCAPEDTAGEIHGFPRGIFLSLLFTAVPLIKGWCDHLPGRIIFTTALVLACLSTGAWLLAASTLQRTAEAERKRHIEEFISSEPGNEPPVHPRFEPFPDWLRLWERINVSGYFFMVAAVVYSVLR